MKILTHLMQIIILFLLIACEETIPTQRIIEYDNQQVPVIVNLNSSTDTIFSWVESEYRWNLEIFAFNGIDSILINGKLFKVFNNGQLRYNTPIPIYMPDVDSLEIKLKVVDEIGLSTEYPPFYIYAKGRIPSPYLLLDWPEQGYSLIDRDNLEYVRFPREVATPTSGIDQYWGPWVKVNVESNLGISSVLMGMSYNGAKIGTENFAYEFGALSPDGKPSLRIKQSVFFMLNTIILNTYIPEKIISDVKNYVREIKIDVFVDATGTTDFNINDHGQICIGMGNVAKFHNDTPQQGQDNGMSARVTKTNQWETLTFQLDPNNRFIRTKNDIQNGEVDMLFLMPSPHYRADNVPLSDAKYYFKNLRVEKVE